MWSPSYEIIVETLTGSEFEVTVSDRDTVGYIKSKIQKYEGIPVSQQHLLYNHRELADATEMRDVPLVNGSRLKLVLGMKGGPISSKRVVTISDYENWFDMSDVLSRQDAANFKAPGLKLLVNKKNIHRLMKVRAEKASDTVKGSVSRTIGSQSSCADLDAEEFERETQKERDDKITAEKLNQIKTKLNMKKKKLANGSPLPDGTGASSSREGRVVKEERSPIARPTFSAGPIGSAVPHYQRPHTSTAQMASIATATREPFLPHINFQSAITTSTNPNVPPSRNSCSSSSTRRAELDRHSQIRENLQRNRSFKTISAKNLNLSGNDITVRDSSRLERSLSYHSQGLLNRMDSDPTTGRGHPTAACYNSTQSQHQLSSASLHDIIELLKYNPSKLRTISHDALNKMVSGSKKHHHHQAKLVDNASLKNIDEFIRDYDVTMTNRLKAATATAAMGTGDCSNLLAESMFNKETTGYASTEIAFDKGSTGSGLDKTFRTLYKSTSDDNTTYELPKLLIREDSPVESFHSSYPQLETVALRGESPKNFNSSATKPSAAAATAATGAESQSSPGSGEQSKLASGSLLTTATSGGGCGGTWAPHYGGVGGHHHSDLGINELELKFVNNGMMEKGGGGVGGGSVFKLPAVSNLEINHWNALSNDSVNNYARSSLGEGGKDKDEELGGGTRTSNGFIHSDLSISSDEDDLFSISDLIYKSQANKSKSIDLNEFRKTFGSSPTLLNNFGGTNCNLAPQLSRLDAIPSQYRRGYTNLNDAGLSCSTSELECVNATTKKKTGGGDNGELSPLLKHRNNDHVAYVRSYENLNRYKAFSMKNGESSDILRCQQGGGQLLPGISNLDSIADSDLNSSSGSGSNLIDDSFTDFEYRFSRLSCAGGGSLNHNGSCTSTNTSSNTQTSSSSSNSNQNATGATHRLHPLTDPNHRTRMIYGHPPGFNNTSSPFSNNNHHHDHHHSSTNNNNNNNNSASAANYYFPSDESLFNIDSFFDDFVEIDTSDIFDNTEYINIGDSRSSSSSKMLQKPNKQSLLLPEILQQDELLLKTHPGGGGSFSESTPGDLLDEGAASAIRQIDAELDSDRTSIERELPTLARLTTPPLKPSSSSVTSTTTAAAATAAPLHHHPAEPVKSKKLRCAQCNRKLGVIMIMKCHCEKIFCAQHRYAEAHNCSFDFKLEGKKLLERENPLVVAQKLPKI